MSEPSDQDHGRPRLHFDPKLTWGHILTTAMALIAIGGMWSQLNTFGDQIGKLTAAIEVANQRVTQVESRTSVLEAQRVANDKRLDEIRETVIDIRRIIVTDNGARR